MRAAFSIACGALLCFLSSLPSPAQKAPAKKTGAGKPAAKPKAAELDAELKAALATAPEASAWPNNDYARLLDIGNVVIKSDGTVVAEYRETYKLFNERARPLAEVELPYNASYQSVKIMRARTIKKDGTVVAVKPEDIRISSPYSEFLMYDDAQTVGFSMPAIEDGCVIDYTFQMVTRPMLMPGQFWTYWGFSGPEPVRLCRYTLTAPADKPLQWRVYNRDDLKPATTKSADGKTVTHSWTLRDIAPIPIEPSMPPLSDVRVWMEVSSLGSWQDIAKWFDGLAKPQAVATDAIRATVGRLTAGKSGDEEKARAIFDWVANRARYVGLEFGISAYRPHPAADVHDKLYGDCKDKTTLLITMLALAGIKADPVLLRAGDRRPVDGQLPTLNAFNHCIAQAEVGGRKFWLDATAETCAFGDIPDADRGAQALVVRNGGGQFETIPLYAAEENGLEMQSEITVQPEGAAEVKMRMQWRGASAHSWRAAVRSLTAEKRRQMAQNLAQSFSPGASAAQYDLPDGMDKEGPYRMTMTAQAPNWAKKTGSLLLLPVANWLNGSDRRNPYTQETRVWPIVETDTSFTRSVTTIRLPEGCAVEDVPEDVHLTGPLQDYHRALAKSADGKTLTITETSSERPGRVPPSDYAKVKAYYDAVIRAADDQIVLRKRK